MTKNQWLYWPDGVFDEMGYKYAAMANLHAAAIEGSSMKYANQCEWRHHVMTSLSMLPAAPRHAKGMMHSDGTHCVL